jgi:hypothetical protein
MPTSLHLRLPRFLRSNQTFILPCKCTMADFTSCSVLTRLIQVRNKAGTDPVADGPCLHSLIKMLTSRRKEKCPFDSGLFHPPEFDDIFFTFFMALSCHRLDLHTDHPRLTCSPINIPPTKSRASRDSLILTFD